MLPGLMARACIVMGAAYLSFAENVHFLKSTRSVDADEIKKTLEKELVGIPLSSRGETHVESLEEALRPLFRSLQADEHGVLGHMASRYALHRLFMQRYSWHVRGLEPGASAAVTAESLQYLNFSLDSAAVWPSFLQDNLEQLRGGSGLSLRDVAALAATLEDLVRQDTIDRLGKIYRMNDISTDALLSKVEVETVIGAYFVLYEKAMYMADSMTEETLLEKQERAFRTHRFKKLIDPWLHGVVADVAGKRGANLDAASFGLLEDIADEVGKRFHQVRALECETMKRTFVSMERKPGRVRLSDFYNKSRSSKWEFSESVSYLRALGTLDETNASNILVLSTNYIMAMPQCLQASTIYSVCCTNQCESLMSELEAELQGPTATPTKLAQIVSKQVSLVLSEKMKYRLESIAKENGGLVPIHGRLFAQWMHHAFPRDCPFPQKMGESQPMTPDEWMKATGSLNAQSSEEEMELHIRPDDTCPAFGAGDGRCWQDADELPWNPSEELLYPATVVSTRGLSFSSTQVAICIAGVVAVLRASQVFVGKAWKYQHAGNLGLKSV
eukprot:TRINITY_DN49192_c0_g1_i1.p1 TRINITY_DN49192_c0_g1~~TRINITY_DN49192_c0_g1_i1.p1  ORF type:complete len:558 (-),score=96.63 TRINITY_DN49192_c0_g1_i1:99-1772(-)